MYKEGVMNVLEFIIRNQAEHGINCNELARKMKVSVGNVHKILKKLKANMIVSEKSIGNGLYYKLNKSNKEAVKLAEIIFIKDRWNRLGKSFNEDLESYGKFGILRNETLFVLAENFRESKIKELEEGVVVLNKLNRELISDGIVVFGEEELIKHL